MAKCKLCGKGFFTKSARKVYCSDECRMTALKIKDLEDEHPCWSCANACGGCSWSENLTPVEGWDAIPIIVKDDEGDIRTYTIHSCPQYKAEDESLWSALNIISRMIAEN